MPRRWPALLVVVLGTFMDQVDVSIVNVALIPIQRDLHAQASLGQWIVAAYALAYALFLVTGGRLGDILGHRRTFLIGVTGFTLASATAGIAAGPLSLIAARAVQGAFGGIMVPQVMSMIAAQFPQGPERARAFTVTGFVLGIGTVSGPVLGGLLTTGGLGWRSIFLINVPVGALALAGALRWMPESHGPRVVRFDLAGTGLLGLASLLLLVPLMQGRELGWPPLLIGSIGLSFLVLAMFWRYERRLEARGGSALAPTSLLCRRSYAVPTLLAVVFGSGISCYFLILAWGLQDGLGWTPLTMAGSLLAWPLGIACTARTANRIGHLHGRRLVGLGTLVMICGTLGLIMSFRSLGIAITSVHLMPWLFGCGVGMGLIVPVLPSTALAAAGEHEAGAASGVFNSANQLGLALGAALAGVIFFLDRPLTALDQMHAVSRTLWFNVAVLVLAAPLTRLLPVFDHGGQPPNPPSGALLATTTE
jgi:MFS family permease